MSENIAKARDVLTAALMDWKDAGGDVSRLVQAIEVFACAVADEEIAEYAHSIVTYTDRP